MWSVSVSEYERLWTDADWPARFDNDPDRANREWDKLMVSEPANLNFRKKNNG